MRRYGWAVLVMAMGLGIGYAGRAQQNRTLDQVLTSGQEKIQKGDTNGALAELLEAIRLQNQLIMQQQQTLLGLTGQMQDQQKTITEQQTTLAKQAEEQQKIAQQTETIAASGGGSYDALLQYEKAYSIQHVAIFEVRQREAPPYFQRAVEEYRVVVDKFAQAEKADDAQYRIAKIYHRYLKDYQKAVAEYQKLLQNYPNSEYVSEATEALASLGARQ